jgi:hypothetical protein
MRPGRAFIAHDRNRSRSMHARAVPPLAALALLSACALPEGVARTDSGDYGMQYTRSELFYAFDGRDAAVRIVGNPFPVPQPALDAAVTETLEALPQLPRADFTTTPGETARGAYRVVMVFDPAEPVVGQRLCASPPASRPPAPGAGPRPVALQAAFCHGANMLSSSYGEVAGVASPDDRGFRQLVVQTALTLFPFRNPLHDDDRACLLRPGRC